MDVSLRSPDIASSRSGWSPRDRASPTAADGGTSGSDRAAVVTGVGASFTYPVPDDTDRAVTPRACSGKGNRALLVVSAVSAWEITTKRLLGKLPQEVASGSCLGKLPQTDVLLVAYSRHLDGLCAVRLSGSRGPRTARWTFGLGPSGSFRPDDRRAGNDRVRGYQHRRSRFRSLPRRTDPLVTRIAPELFALKKSAMSVKFAALQWFSTQDDMR